MAKGARGHGGSGEADTGKSLSRRHLRPEAWLASLNAAHRSSSRVQCTPCPPAQPPAARGHQGFGREVPELGRGSAQQVSPSPASSIPSAPSAPALTTATMYLPTPCPLLATKGESEPVGAGTGQDRQPGSAWEPRLVQELCSEGQGWLRGPPWGRTAGSVALGPDRGVRDGSPEEVPGRGIVWLSELREVGGHWVTHSFGITWGAEGGAGEPSAAGLQRRRGDHEVALLPAVRSSCGRHGSLPVRSPRSPSRSWTHQSCRTTST